MFTDTTIWKFTRKLLLDPSWFWYLAALIVLGDALLTQLIIRFVPCQKLSQVLWTPPINHLYRHRNRLGDVHVSH